jgi:tRNA-splicing ligase RtcB
MKEKIKKVSDVKWEIPVSFKEGMRVPGVIYADDQLMSGIRKDASLEQVANAAFLPGIVKASLAMPDMHYGYGLPIGGVVATAMEGGVISPGGVGFDINCGVRLVSLRIHRDELEKEGVKRTVVETLYRDVPTGVGSKGKIKLNENDRKKILVKGAKWAVDHGFGDYDDLDKTEAAGCLEGADPEVISPKAYERGKAQPGTLGSGNHFIEVQYVDEIYYPEAAGVFGLDVGQVAVMIHSGSRGFGHQVCTDFLGLMEKAVKKYGIEIPDRQLACAPLDSPEGQRYLSAMKAAANYAWANRQCLMYWTEEALQKALKKSPSALGMSLIYDVAHNIVKIEEHEVDGRRMRLAVHRKGATRAFGPGHEDVPSKYRPVGQPVIIPGDMGTSSYLLVGTEKAMLETFGSTCHGAGRVLSRKGAIKASKGRAIHRELEDQGVVVRATGRTTLREEMPEAYKDVSSVVDVVQRAGIGKKVARLRPLGVIKG